MSGNYPDGVSDTHPYFNPPFTKPTALECGADEALVVPSYAVKAILYPLQGFTDHYAKLAKDPKDAANFHRLGDTIAKLIEQIGELQQEREYECPFNGDVEVEESECARWDCPVCGNERETDTMPEEVDPDRAYEEMRDARYDD